MTEPIRLYATDAPICRSHPGGVTTIEGYAAVFHDPADPGTEFDLGRMTERIARGAFADSIANADVVALFNHDPNQVLGRVSAGTMTLAEDDRGLRYTIDAGAGIGRQVAESVARGDIRGSSFSAMISRAREITDGPRPVVVLERLDLIDVGPVTFPAYSGTSSTARSRQASATLQTLRAHSRRRRLRQLTLDLITSGCVR